MTPDTPQPPEDPTNPFGEGGFDMNALLAQAQQMQEQLASAQAELAETEVEGTVGGGLVTVKVSGTGDLTGVQVKAGSFDPDDPDSLGDLGDMIVAAYRDARAHADAVAQQKLGPMAGGLGDLGDVTGGPEGPTGGGQLGFGGGPAGV